MLQEGSGEISGYRNRIAGFDYLHKKGFDSLRGDTGETEDITGGTYGKGSKWNRESNKGVYGSIGKKSNTNCHSDNSRFCVIDPGQINPLTLRAFTLKDGMECEAEDDASLIVTEAEYHRDVGSTDNRLWQEAVKTTPEIKIAVDALSVPIQTQTNRDNRIITEAKYWEILWSERTNIKYDRNRMQRKCGRDAYIIKVSKWIKEQGCKAVWFGTGACKARGHRPVPTKSMMRGIGRYLPVLAGNEWGTSSRCPSCRNGRKLTSCSDKKSENINKHSSEAGGTDVPVEDMLATQPESQSKHLPLNPLPTPRPSSSTEHRFEICTHCKKKWGHDEVATINQKMRFTSLLLGKPDPKWLAHGSVSNGCASQRKSAIT